MNHGPSVDIVSWQRSEHGKKYIPKVWTMLRQLLSSHDNCQSMVIYPYDINHAPSVVIV